MGLWEVIYDRFSGRLLVSSREKIALKKINTIMIPDDILAVPIELNINNSNWLFLPMYKFRCQNESYFFYEVHKAVGLCSASVQDLFPFNEFNLDTTNHALSTFIWKH